MSRKVVLMVVFLAVLPVLMLLVKTRGADPPKNAGGTPTLQNAGGTPAPQKQAADASDPFGGAGVQARG